MIQKYFLSLALSALLFSCDNKTKTVSNSSHANKQQTDSLNMDGILTFTFETNFSNPNISNKSDRQIDLLFNGVGNYFGGHSHPNVNFRSECMSCEPIQEYLGGILFAKRLLITSDQIKYYKNDFDVPDSFKRIKIYTDAMDSTNPKFKFSDGKVSIKYIGVSCNDADFNKVQLSYPTGEIVIDSLINASFFEYDLNKNGQNEQYLFGSRNCSQEFVLLRIRTPNDIK